MNRRLIAPIASLAVVLAICFTYLFFLMSVPVSVFPAVELAIAPGEPATAVASRLQDAGVVRSARVLLFVARRQNLDRAFRHGLHEFRGALTPDAVLRELVTPPTPTVRVTIPEGLTWHEVGRLLEDHEIVTADSYYEAVCDPEFLTLAGASPHAHCAEGLLYPDTYNLAPYMSAAEIARMQLGRFREVLGSVLAKVDFSKEEGDFVHRTIVLASIIEKETSIESERGLVSSVFHNRLRRGMRLQADPTVIYGLHAAGVEWDGTALHKQLRKPGPYNTYTTDGLPPGAICNPGRASLEAALMPPDSDYIYFVATGDGAHKFSQTLDQHNAAVARLRAR